ncbi:hypothetical protein EJ110_NYTH44741 [Nymphaea thermarum]|nr:hypothetical protein EJ110_NYTH44741 [Nymphaea thermarum]
MAGDGDIRWQPATGRHPLINFIATSANGPIFLKAIDASGEHKSVEYLKGLFMEIIEEVEKDKVVQLSTDNAPACKAAGVVIEKEYPHIFYTPCAVHSLNLALKSICNPPSKEQDPHVYELCLWIEDLEKGVRNIRNFIVNPQHALSIYNKHSDLKLLRVAETRFASLIAMVKRIKRVKSALISMVTDDDWSFCRTDDDDKAQATKRLILEDKWEGETKNWDVNVEDFNLEQENELEIVNSRFKEPCIPSTSSIVEEEEIQENDLGIDDD